MSDKIFVDGMQFDPPKQGAPSFVKGKISVRVQPFVEFCNKYANEAGFINIDLFQSQKGNLYLALNTYKKPVQKEEVEPQEFTVNPTVSEIPF